MPRRAAKRTKPNWKVRCTFSGEPYGIGGLDANSARRIWWAIWQRGEAETLELWRGRIIILACPGHTDTRTRGAVLLPMRVARTA
jgi:hypothetical protein